MLHFLTADTVSKCYLASNSVQHTCRAHTLNMNSSTLARSDSDAQPP